MKIYNTSIYLPLKNIIRPILSILFRKRSDVKKIIFFHLMQTRSEYKVCIIEGNRAVGIPIPTNSVPRIPFHLYFNFPTLYDNTNMYDKYFKHFAK